ncbi:MAG: polymerase [Acetobacteraceae bacterium]|jgi:DNA polymerase (family 10)|nr:polymerase [Acetobacteraceae bacterium]
MPVFNAEISSQLEKVADLLDLEGAPRSRGRAYRMAARLVGALTDNVADMLVEGTLVKGTIPNGTPGHGLPGIGKDIADQIAAIVRGETPTMLDRAAHEPPAGITALLALPGLGPTRVHLMRQTLGIDTIEKLAAAVRAGKLRAVPGLGGKLEAKLLRIISTGARLSQRTERAAAEPVVAALLRYLRQIPGVLRAEIAGSFRRRQETVGNLDIVVAIEAGRPVVQRFLGCEHITELIEQGPARAIVRLRQGMQADLRVVPEENFGAALCIFTGSKAHTVALRRIAFGLGWRLDEHGLFDGVRRLGGRTEAEIYQHLGLAFVPPELREDQGELDAARDGTLPHLVTTGDIRGDFHVRTTDGSGRGSLQEMVQAAIVKGYGYIAIADHAHHTAAATARDPMLLARQLDAIDRINSGLDGFVVLKSCEVDILRDGSLDLPGPILRRLDLVVGGIQSDFDLSSEEQTERMLRAMDNRCLDILAHPTGRLNQRPGVAMDNARVIRGAAERGCCLELNARPDRLDLNDAHCRLAKQLGAKVAISSGARAAEDLDFMRFGIDQARRGWLEKTDVLNTQPLSGLREVLRQRR